jgi:hypothetical protein
MTMPSFKGQFFSIVFIGRQNPQILNHDFLFSHGVLPKDKEPFKNLFAKQDSQPFTEFISTPVITSIKYGPISLVVEENRYQIIDNRFEDPPSSPIIQITKKYFEELLRYLPVAIDLIGRCFSSIQDLHLQLEQDPEVGEEWLVLDVTIQGEVEEVLNEYDNYTDHWVSSVPWPERDKIRLSYNVI